MEFIVNTLALKLGYLVQILVLPFITHFNLGDLRTVLDLRLLIQERQVIIIVPNI